MLKTKSKTIYKKAKKTILKVKDTLPSYAPTLIQTAPKIPAAKITTHHKLIIGNSMSMGEIPDESVHLMVTSPPYFNAPFDYKGLFKNYEQYLGVLNRVALEVFRVLKNGRIVVLNIDDMLIQGEKFPIVADATKIFLKAGFRYRDRIVWKKPEGYLRISRRSGVMLQHPYPMYFYPDNLLESIIIFQKGKFDYHSIPKEVRDASKIDIKEFSSKKWYMTLWEMVNVLPGSQLEKDIAAFPEELPRRITKTFLYRHEIVRCMPWRRTEVKKVA